MAISTPPTPDDTQTKPNGNDAAPVPATLTSPPLWLCDVTKEPVAPDACLACARNGRPEGCSFTPPILEALRSSMKSDAALRAIYSWAAQQDVTVLRVSSLTGCTRKAWYRLIQGTPLETPSRHWARLRGTIFHKALESMADETVMAEQRFIVDLRPFGVKAAIAGMVDHYDPATGVLTDLKTMNTWKKLSQYPDLPHKHHIAQVWIYGWLLEKAGLGYPRKMEITYMTMGDIRTVPVGLPTPEGKQYVEARIVAKAKAIVEADPTQGPKGDAQADWECRYCLFKAACPDKRKTPPKPKKKTAKAKKG